MILDSLAIATRLLEQGEYLEIRLDYLFRTVNPKECGGIWLAKVINTDTGFNVSAYGETPMSAVKAALDARFSIKPT